jgi:hypothetical protein
MRIFGRGKGRSADEICHPPIGALLWGLAKDFEDVKAEFEAEDTDRCLGIEPSGSEDSDRFDNLPDLFTIGVGLVAFHGGTSCSSFALVISRKRCIAWVCSISEFLYAECVIFA